MSVPVMGAITPVGSNFVDEFATALASMLGKLEGGGFSETGKKSAAAAERASDAEAVHNVLEVTNFWFGLGAQAQAHHQASGLDPIAIEGALQDGKIVHWGEWTIRPTPPRYVLVGDGEEYWISTVWVSALDGAATTVSASGRRPYEPSVLSGVISKLYFWNNFL